MSINQIQKEILGFSLFRSSFPLFLHSRPPARPSDFLVTVTPFVGECVYVYTDMGVCVSFMYFHSAAMAELNAQTFFTIRNEFGSFAFGFIMVAMHCNVSNI